MNRLLRLTLFILPGTVLIILAVVLGWVILPNVITGKIIEVSHYALINIDFTEQVRLVEGSDTWMKWKEAPIPVYINFYIHHVTNPGQVEDGLTPVFKEKGPYVYREKKVKVDLRQEDGPNTVRYREVTTFYFDQKRSGNNSQDDLVNVPNIPFIAVLNTVRKQLPLDLIVGLVGNFVLFQENLIRRDVPVREFLFDGFDVSKYTDGLLGSRLPEAFSGGRFGLYKGRNGTASKQFEVYTGYDDSANFGKVKSWDTKSELGFWRKYSKCDKIIGTDGSTFRPFLTRSSVLDIFGAELCSSIAIKYEKDIEFKGVTGYRFRTPQLTGDYSVDGPTLEERQCFCLEDDSSKCPKAGVLSLESCRKAPIFSSLPYFLDTDVRVWAQSGLPRPEKEKHETFVDVEPNTGLLLRAHKRLQINLEVRSNNKVRALRYLTKESFLFPVMWADENAELSDDLIESLQSTLFTPLKIIDIGKWVVLGLGILILLLGLIAFIILYVTRSPTDEGNQKTNLKLSSLDRIRGGEIPVGSEHSRGTFPSTQSTKRSKNQVASSSSSSSVSTVLSHPDN